MNIQSLFDLTYTLKWLGIILKLKKCAHFSTYPTGIFFYVLSALYVFRPFLQRHARSAVFFSSMLAKDFIITCHFPSNSLWKATLKRMMLGNQLAYFACMRNVLKAKVKLYLIFLFKTSIHHNFLESKIAI